MQSVIIKTLNPCWNREAHY